LTFGFSLPERVVVALPHPRPLVALCRRGSALALAVVLAPAMLGAQSPGDAPFDPFFPSSPPVQPAPLAPPGGNLAPPGGNAFVPPRGNGFFSQGVPSVGPAAGRPFAAGGGASFADNGNPPYAPAGGNPQPAAGYPPAAPSKLPRNEEILAYVGPDVVLMGDVLPEVEHLLKQVQKEKGPIPENQIDDVRKHWIRQRLKGAIEIRQILVAVRQKLPEEQYQKIRSQMQDVFEKKQVKQYMERFKLTDRSELSRRAVELLGVPISRAREDFVDQVVAASFIQQSLPKDEEPSHAETLAYYQLHARDFEFPAKARWEQLRIDYDKKKRTRDEAWQLITQLGDAMLGGAPFAEIARRYSDDPFSAKDGGAHPWIRQGSLVAEKVDAALFTLPVGTLSPIIEDQDAFHIIRVIERQAAGKTPFEEAQREIKEKIKKQKADQKRREIIENIRKQVHVLNLYEEQFPKEEPRSPRETSELRD